jgi:hypothetical protein
LSRAIVASKKRPISVSSRFCGDRLIDQITFAGVSAFFATTGFTTALA